VTALRQPEERGGPDPSGPDYVQLTTDIVKAVLSNPSVDLGANDVPTLIAGVHGALVSLTRGAVPREEPRPEPAVPVRSSVQPDYVVCLEDGRRLRSMRRYLAVRYGMTPDDYRRKWNLPADYPMTAPSYRDKRSALAKQHGLGRRAVPAPAATSAPKAARQERGRRKA
jgi:predicted transcriptional regulator